MTSWPARGRRERAFSVISEWFSPRRWSQNDVITGLAAVVLVVAVFLPWFRAIVRIRNSNITGFLFQPSGTVNGLAAHAYLWVAVGLALLQMIVLAAHYAPRQPGLTVPGYRYLLVASSGLSAITVLAAVLTRPAPWYGNVSLGGLLDVTVGWSYGGMVALAAAIVSTAIGIASIQDRRR